MLVHVHATEIATDVFADFKQLLSEVGMRKVMLLIRDAPLQPIPGNVKHVQSLKVFLPQDLRTERMDDVWRVSVAAESPTSQVSLLKTRFG